MSAYRVTSPDALPAPLASARRERLNELTPRIAFYCADRSHAEAPWFVGAFEWSADPHARWFPSLWYPTRSGLGFRLKTSGLLVREMDGNRRLSNDEDDEVDLLVARATSPQYRVRYAIKCGTCGLGPIRTAENANDDLDLLWSKGLIELSVGEFSAFLRVTGRG